MFLSKGAGAGPIVTQLGPVCAQTMPRLPRVGLRQAELFQMNYGRHI